MSEDKSNTMEDILVNACKKVVDAETKDERAQAMYELDRLMCEIKEVIR